MKYPRTPHLTFSEGCQDDDKFADPDQQESLLSQQVVVTEKLDGSNCCIDRTGVYARSHNGTSQNPWDSILWMVQQELFEVLNQTDYRIFGENMYAIHSIEYDRLDSFFYVIGIQERSTSRWLSWHDTEQFCLENSLKTVPVLFKGRLRDQEKDLKRIFDSVRYSSKLGREAEGIVVRKAMTFFSHQFEQSVLKMVRKDHVKTDQRWKTSWQKARLNG